ncbi:MAG: hypothetical protein KGN02_08215 [bacterium]|nr:hypothetical protein [bacterium]
MMRRLLLFATILAILGNPFAGSPSAAPAAAAVVASTTLHYFSTESSAHAHCPHDVVVWLNIPSGIYHYKGERWYGRTRNGAFVCEKEAIAAGDRASENGQ